NRHRRVSVIESRKRMAQHQLSCNMAEERHASAGDREQRGYVRKERLEMKHTGATKVELDDVVADAEGGQEAMQQCGLSGPDRTAQEGTPPEVIQTESISTS